MNDVWMFLSKYIPLQEKPQLSLPIVALVIGWWFLSKSIDFLQKDKHSRLQLTHQQLCQELWRANRRILFLSMLLLMLVGFSYTAAYLLVSVHPETVTY